MDTSKVYFYLSRDTKQPERGTNQAAGIDLFMPNYSEEFLNDLREKNSNIEDLKIFPVFSDKSAKVAIIIPPHERVIVPTGVYAYIQPKESALLAANKSGVATKKGLSFTCELIDSDYSGEIYVGLVNTSNENQIIESGDKIIQVIHIPVYFPSLEQLNDKIEFEKLHENSQRKNNAFGSTDKNN